MNLLAAPGALLRPANLSTILLDRHNHRQGGDQGPARGISGQSWSQLLSAGLSCNPRLTCMFVILFMKQLINLPFPQSMHHVPASVVCDQLIPCKQSDNHCVYPNNNFRRSDVENCPCRESYWCCCCAQESCVADPSVRNTKKLRDKPNLLASIRVGAASDGAGAGSETQIPWLRPGPATGLRGHNTQHRRHGAFRNRQQQPKVSQV